MKRAFRTRFTSIFGESRTRRKRSATAAYNRCRVPSPGPAAASLVKFSYPATKGKLALLFCCVLVAFGCGGGGAGAPSASTPSTPVVVSGVFSGTYRVGNDDPITIVGVIPSGGSGIFVDVDDYWILPAFRSDGSLSGVLNWVVPTDQSTEGLPEPTDTISASATGNPATAISGAVTSSAGGSASVSLSATAPTQLYAGSYVGLSNLPTGGEVAVTVGADGTITETGCTFCQGSGSTAIGTIAPFAGIANVSTLTLAGGYGSSQCSTCDATMTGYAFMSSADALRVQPNLGLPGPYLYLIANNSTNGVVFELFPQ